MTRELLLQVVHLVALAIGALLVCLAAMGFLLARGLLQRRAR
jgi:hypothetical protein